ncbi:MAG: monooxygenase [Novosphingobium sp. PASSN1]|nr:MAG: monooxygenase [Novosphingobium sp. PASSN1]
MLVAVPIPAGMPRDRLAGLFVAAVPDYAKVPGLVRKYFTIGDDNKAGGIYLWSSRAAAEAWYNDAWQAGVLKRWGKPAEIHYFAVPATVDGQNVEGFKPQ